MKFVLKEKDQTPVGKRMEERLTYQSEDGTAIVQFNAGKRAWTWEIGTATNTEGRKLASSVIGEYCRVGAEAMQNGGGEDAFNEATKTLEVKA